MTQLSRLSFFVLLLCLGFTQACSSNDEEVFEESESMEAPVASDTSPMPAPVQDDGDARAQRNAAYIDAFLNKAQRMLDKGDANAAKQEVLKALALDDGHARAQAKLGEINAILGQSSTAQDMAQEVIQHKRSTRAKQAAEVNDRFVRAQQALERNELDEAKSHLEFADLIIKYDAYQTDFGSTREDVANLLNQVNREIEATASRRESDEWRSAWEKLREEDEKDRRRRAETVRAMMIEAFEAFERQDFDHSEHVAMNVLDLVPSFREAKELVDMSRRARHADWRRTYYKRRREQVQVWKERMRDTQIPWHHVIRFPDRKAWDRITQLRGSTDAVSEALEDSEIVRTLKNKLATETVSWEFADMTLDEVVKYVRDTQNVNVLMSKTTFGEKAEEVVDFNVRELNFGDALRTLLAPLELTYTFKYDLIYIVGLTEASGAAIPRVYEVRDLTIQLPDFRPPNLQLRPGPAGETAMLAVFGEEGEPVRETEPEQLLDLVKDNVAPASWEIEGRDAQLSAGQLVAVTTPEVHREIERFLEDLRRFTKVIVHVETRFIALREGFLSDIGVDIRGGGGANPGNIALLDDVTNGNDDNSSLGFDNNGPGGAAAASQSPTSGAFFRTGNNFDGRGRTENIFNRALGGFLSGTGGATIGFSFLDEVDLNFILRAVEKSAFANVLTAPRLTIYNNQRANLTLVNQVSYVKDYDVEVAQTAFIADPLVDIVQDGLVLDVRPTVSHDRKYVTLEVRPTVAILQRPIQTFVTPLAGLTTNVIIELPEIEYRAASTTVRVPDNGWVVIGGLKSISTVDRRSETPVLSQIPILNFFFSRKGRSDELSDLIVVLHVNIIDLEEEEAKLTR